MSHACLCNALSGVTGTRQCHHAERQRILVVLLALQSSGAVQVIGLHLSLRPVADYPTP